MIRIAILALMLSAAPAHAQGFGGEPPGAAAAEQTGESLVKSALLTFNDANLADDYTVWRKRLHPTFQKEYTPERLRETFAVFRTNKIDITEIAAQKPRYDAPPKVEANGWWAFKGQFAGPPSVVTFDLKFAKDGEAWKLVHITVNVRPTN
jgi:hypothetical protein